MRNSHPRTGRTCSRAGCRDLASKTLTYIYSDSTAVLGPLATFAEPHAYDLCDVHGDRMTAPLGWTVIRQEPNDDAKGPTEDDLMAIADAVREAGIASTAPSPTTQVTQEIGRRGHLRALPSN